MARSVLRSLLIGGCLFGLLLPTRRSGERTVVPWIGLFLLSALISVAMSGRTYAAEMEWETWALTILFTVLVRRVSVPSLRKTALVALYVVAMAVYFHSLWISIPGTISQLGGVFHHPNALSSFTIFVLPFFIDRAGKGGREGYFAAFLSGAMLALQLWAGSMTGACILVFGLAFWLTASQAWWRRLLISLAVLPLPIFFNLWGGWISVFGFTVLFLVLLFLALSKLGSSLFPYTLVFLLMLTISIGAFTFLSPLEMSSRSVRDRSNSASARLEFYRAALSMTASEPLFGHGPTAFSREYPRYQRSVRYFSRYVHSVPLEILVECGLLGLVLGGLACRSLFHKNSFSVDASCWALAGFGLHCLTGVQSQFPYLLVLVGLAWALTAEPSAETECGSFWTESSARVLLLITLLSLLSLNTLRLESAVEQGLGTKIFSSPDPRARPVALSLFRSSVERQPMDGQALLSFAQVQLSEENKVEARALAHAAIATDLQWAAPRRVALLASPSPPELRAVQAALSVDPVNYPLFYRLQAEALIARGAEEEALTLLLSHAPDYNPLLLESLHDFRAEDLDAQLVEYWLLIALLQEGSGRSRLAESAFRRSLFFTRRSLGRYRSMVRYPSQSGLQAGPVVGQLLAQLAQQLPAE